MNKNYLIYADICCLCRSLDDLQQSRVKLEAEAMLSILEQCEQKKWTLVNSDALQFEIAKNSDLFKKEQLEAILSIATNYLQTNDTIESLASDLVKLGFKLYDALHLAFSQTYNLDIFLTTDDRLLRKAKKYPDLITIKVENPVVWLMNILQEETYETNRN
ncbi:PIN domain-containing protein [Dolichospermum sp. ST_con]|nr:PIN domain-containing protein [Dolichospermum sp. ST_con]MDD1421270.1 PIN domain-containing protein [Dolichospermum sp. ST_sed1]MDD1426715.1 PIN domain-containing protein [Dolichospermum sp. ST_sed9]MDD1431926.1 PIN domain-containing protein [Dolichospermum sp. ST_sed6]MDD1435842.1 PIN domain-containing protein [Dolichospermum sp. ST_sed10]MDD1441364.1 PIN domain-containing protein [Dolichospermum sp. ST_sed3]MDD1448019.1 PIN domain-containing protein [Dolichospermum sp. ST_sed8]MDD145542